MSIKRRAVSVILGDVPCGPEALPCPFCGEQPVYHPPDGVPAGRRYIGCENIACEAGPFVTGATRRITLQRWNTRASVDEVSP